MSSADRFPYLSATVLDQAFLDACHDNLTSDLEMIATIEAPDGSTLYVSDRNKYVGSTFYEALIQFPVIKRTLGEWLSGSTEFSTMNVRLSNVDKRFNKYMPEGANFDGWIDRRLTISLGLRDVASTYKVIFDGSVTPEAGFARDVKSVKLVARDRYDRLRINVPPKVFTITDYPQIETSVVGKAKAVIYGDWTTALGEKPASGPAFVVNGADPDVVGGLRNNVQLVISDNDNRSFDTSNVYLLRSSTYYLIAAADVTSVSIGLNAFEIVQNGATSVEGSPFVFTAGDEFFVRVTGKDIGYNDNFVWIARDILIAYGGATSGQFDANWATYRDKSTPAESAIASMKARVWQLESITALDLAISLLEEVRLEMFISRDELIKINSLHFEDFVADPSYEIQNWDVVLDSWEPAIDLRNNFNRAKGLYSLMPDTGEELFETPYFRNQPAIDQSRREIAKGIVLPHHYVAGDAENQVKEILKLGSSFFEVVDAQLTWRSMLQDIGGFIKVNVKIQSAQYSNVPMMIRAIGFDPAGLKIPVSLWSMQMVNFPGWAPGNPGIVGGSDATITQE